MDSVPAFIIIALFIIALFIIAIWTSSAPVQNSVHSPVLESSLESRVQSPESRVQVLQWPPRDGGGGGFYDTLTAAPNAQQVQIGAPKSRGGLRGNVNNMGPHGPLSNGGSENLWHGKSLLSHWNVAWQSGSHVNVYDIRVAELVALRVRRSSSLKWTSQHVRGET